MTCSVIACEQLTPEWFAARTGLITGTDAAAMLSRPKKNGEDPVGKSELRLRLALEAGRGVPVYQKHYMSDDMRLGREREADAIGAYEARTGDIVQTVGFLRHQSLPIGCSPDGIVGNFDGGLEVKCPKFTTHYEYLQKGTLPSEYAAQVTHALFVSGLPWWDFCSYSPEFDGQARLFVVRVYAHSVNLPAYELAFTFFWKEVEQIKETLRALSAPEELIHA